jgi:hypothetical protein
MSTKYNVIIDNTAVRIGMTLVGFGAWFCAGFALLKF